MSSHIVDFRGVSDPECTDAMTAARCRGFGTVEETTTETLDTKATHEARKRNPRDAVGMQICEAAPAEIEFSPSHDTQQRACGSDQPFGPFLGRAALGMGRSSPRNVIEAPNWPRPVPRARHPRRPAPPCPPGPPTSPMESGLPTWGTLGRPHRDPTASTTAGPCNGRFLSSARGAARVL